MATSNRRFNRSTINNALADTGSVTRNITPSPNILNVLEQSGYKVEEAIQDIIDNSIDADSTKITLQIGHNNTDPFLIISDNGLGMTPDILFGALCLGADEPELGDKNKNGGTLGKFGIGMKSSMANLQGKNIIYTKVKDGDLIKVCYDKEVIQKHWDDHKEWGITIDMASPEDIEFFKKYTNDSEQGTVIKIHKIKRFNHGSCSDKASTLKRVTGQTFRRFIHNGHLNFEVNGTKIEAFDPCGDDIPFEYNGKLHKSKSMTELEFNNLEYIDSNGKKKLDGYLRYRSFLLPQKDVIDEDAMVRKFGWNMDKQGISVMRNNREIQHKGWFEMAKIDSRLNRFKVVIDFTSEMDREWGADFKKTSVVPDEYILKQIRPDFEADCARARKAFDASTQTTAIPASLSKIMEALNKFLTRQDKLIGALPVGGKKQDPDKIGTGAPRSPYTIGQAQDKLVWHIRTDMPGRKWYETFTTNSQKKSIQVDLNMKHPMYEYIKTIDKRNGIMLGLQIYTSHFGQQDALSCLTKPKDRQELTRQFDEAAEKQGNMLWKLCPLAPKDNKV